MVNSGLRQLQQRKDQNRIKRTPPPPSLHPKAGGADRDASRQPFLDDTAAPTVSENRHEATPTSDGYSLTVDCPEDNLVVPAPRHPILLDSASAETILSLFIAAGEQAVSEIETWLQNRTAHDALSELLSTVAQLWPADRDGLIAFIERFFPDPDTALRRATWNPTLAPWICSLVGIQGAPYKVSLGDLDLWMQIEQIVRAHCEAGSKAAYKSLWRRLCIRDSEDFSCLVQRLLGSTHPQADYVAREVRRVHGSGSCEKWPNVYILHISSIREPNLDYCTISLPADITGLDLRKILSLVTYTDIDMTHILHRGSKVRLSEYETDSVEHLQRWEVGDVFTYGYWGRAAYSVKVDQIFSRPKFTDLAVSLLGSSKFLGGGCVSSEEASLRLRETENWSIGRRY